MHRYNIVSDNDIEQIHENTLKIMENIGIVFDGEDAREILSHHGAKIDGKRVYFPRGMVAEKLKSVPSSFTLHGRDPKYDVTIDTQHVAFAGPYGSPFVTDIERGRRPGTLEDFINIVKICHNLRIDVQSHISCEPQDVEVGIRHLAMTYHTMKYSSKPLMGTVYGYEKAKKSISLAAEAFGGLEEIKDKPIIASIPCTLTPLSYDTNQAGAIIAYAETGQPQLVNSLSMAGATTPATVAGTVSLQNAEVLAGIVLSQCVNPGCPIVYSASGSNIDMRMGALSIGSVEDAIISLVNGHLAKFYNIPCRISGALSDSKTMDSQAALESTFTLLMAQMAGGNFILHSAGIIDSYNTISYEKLILDNELLGMIRRMEGGVEVNEDTLAYDAIEEVGPQGSFLVHDHTFAHYREFYDPTIVNRHNYDEWFAEGAQTIEVAANKRWKKILAEYEEPALDTDVDKAMRAYFE